MGLYATGCTLYIAYLFLVSLVSWQWIFPYSEYEILSLETIMWISNAGYILYELLEFENKGALYFSTDSIINVFDTTISVNWIILFFLRMLAPLLGGENYMDDEGPKLDPTIDRANHPELEDESAWTRTDPTKRNETYTIIFMGFWSLQLIILWIRTVGLLQRTEIMGPLLRMMLFVAKDVASFLILVVAVTFGFLFAVHFIVAGDIDRDVTCDVLVNEFDGCEEAEININSARAILIYLIQTLLGQQEWSVLNENMLYGFGRPRAQLLTLVVLAYVLLGTILSLNMLIAIMTNSFEMLNDKAAEQLAFLRVETTYDLGHRGRTMPPPFNIFVIGIWVLITAINMLIKGLTCGNKKLNLDRLNPYYIACLRRGREHGKSTMIQRNDKSDVKYSAKKEIKSVEKELQKMQTEAETLPKLENVLSTRFTAQFETFSYMFEKIDSLADDTKKRYCKHCYCRMRGLYGGKIDDYFKLFETGSGGKSKSFNLDKDDVRMIKRLFRYCSLCPQCFRPYGFWKKSNKEKSVNDAFGDMETDRFDRHHVLMDVISCYFFLILVWIPLIIICFIPAVFSICFGKINDLEQTKYTSNKRLDAGAFGDYHGGTQQQRVRSIVDHHYGGSHTFDEESDDDRNDDDSDTARLEKMVNQLMEKMDAMSEETEINQHKKHKKTTNQLQKHQRRANISKSRRNILNVDSMPNKRSTVRFEDDDKKEQQEDNDSDK